MGEYKPHHVSSGAKIKQCMLASINWRHFTVTRHAIVLNRAPLEYFPYHEWLSDLGYTISLIIPSEMGYSTPSLPREVYTDIELIDNYDASDRVEQVAFHMASRARVDCLIAPSEIDLIRAGRLRDRLGIEGQSETSAIRFRDKFAMKSRLSEANIAVPKFALLADTMNHVTDWRRIGDSVLLKPRDGFGSKGIFKINSDASFAEAIGLIQINSTVEEYYAEEFIDGELFHVDGLIRDGLWATGWPSRYLYKPLDYSTGAHGGSYMIDQGPLAHDLIDFAKAIIIGIGSPSVASFHAEIFRTSDGRLLAGEIASRTAGNKIRDVIQAGLGIDLTREWVRAQVGAPSAHLPQLPERLAGWGGIRRFPGFVVRTPEQPSGADLLSYHFQGEVGDEIDVARDATDNIASIVCCGHDEEHVSAYLKNSLSKIRLELTDCIKIGKLQ